MMFCFRNLKSSLIFVFCCFAGIASGDLCALERETEKPLYMILVASEIASNSTQEPSRQFIAEVANAPLSVVSKGFQTSRDLIDALMSDDESQVNESIKSLVQNYTKILSLGEKDVVISTLVNIVNCRRDLSSKLLLENTGSVLSLSKNCQTSPYNLFSIVKLKKFSSQYNNKILESLMLNKIDTDIVESDITLNLAGKMTSEFAQKYSNTCLDILKFKINYRLEHEAILCDIISILEQAGSIASDTDNDNVAEAIYSSLESGNLDNFSQALGDIEELPETSEAIEKFKTDFKNFLSKFPINSIRDSMPIVIALDKVLSVCDLYKNKVNEKWEDFQQKTRQLETSYMFICMDNFFKSIDQITPFLSKKTFTELSKEINLTFSDGNWQMFPKTLETIKEEVESNSMEKLIEFQRHYQLFETEFPTWNFENLKSIVLLRSELNRTKSLPDMFQEERSIFQGIAPHIDSLTPEYKKLLLGFAHFLKFGFD